MATKDQDPRGFARFHKAVVRRHDAALDSFPNGIFELRLQASGQREYVRNRLQWYSYTIRKLRKITQLGHIFSDKPQPEGLLKRVFGFQQATFIRSPSPPSFAVS